MTPEKAADRYLGHLRFAVTSIETRLSGASKSAA
jgi:hypothetical protein